ncbi:hypothetical protein Droror1_Dr00026847 [Drosera rotundifolia]
MTLLPSLTVHVFLSHILPSPLSLSLSPCHSVVGDSSIPTAAAADLAATPLAALQSRGCRRLVIEDDFYWALPDGNGEDEGKEEVLRYVGGVDVSFSKEDLAVAFSCIVVLDVVAVDVVYEDYYVTRLEVPYVAGFLTFREVCLVGYRADGVLMKFVVRESGYSVKDFRVVWVVEGRAM